MRTKFYYRWLCILNFLLSVFFLCSVGQTFGPQLSDGWYPQNKVALNALLDTYLNCAVQWFPVHVPADSVRALVVPHAGYRYSGFCAACAYASLLHKNKKNKYIKRVILLAPSHNVTFKGLALPDFLHYKTALGSISLDMGIIKALKKDGVGSFFREAFEYEHAVEVELPFLQKTIAQFTLVPLIVGHVTTQECKNIVAKLKPFLDDSTLLVISSDFVHYGKRFGYEPFVSDYASQLRMLDGKLLSALEGGSPEQWNAVLSQTEATVCGRAPLEILCAFQSAGILGAVDVRLSCYYSSAQVQTIFSNTPLEPESLFAYYDLPESSWRSGVSYMGLVYTNTLRDSLDVVSRLTGYETWALLALARTAIAQHFATKKHSAQQIYPIASAGVAQKVGAFVTLKKTQDGSLRGCIGRIETTDPLYKTVYDMAQSAAFHDSRFSPLTAKELPLCSIDITILEVPRVIDRWQAITVGTHGVILQHGLHRAVFLPQVAVEQGWDVPTLLGHLARKAGLPAHAWRDKEATFEVFKGGEIHE